MVADVTTRETLPLALQAYEHIRLPYGNRLLVTVRRAVRAFQFSGPEGDDMRKVQRTIHHAFEESGGVGESGPLADANKAIAMLQRRVSGGH